MSAPASASRGAPGLARAFFDRGVALAVLLLSSPLMLLSAVAIKASSRGPVIYRAQRAGMGGVPFTMFKLRTMHRGADTCGAITAARDPRTFAAGRVIRRLKLDELPQLWNVLTGEMNLVGPRPEDIGIVQRSYTSLMWETLRIPPGMTSAGSLHYFLDEAQLPNEPARAEQVYLQTLLPAKIAVDLQYVRHPSFGHELRILLRTLLAVFGVAAWFEKDREREERVAQDILREEQ